MVNKCHAKRDIKTCSITLIRHCPAHIIIGRAIQWNMPSGAAGLLCFDAAPFDARMTAERAALKHRWKGTKQGSELVNTYARIARRCVV
ncbi:hypothetical protein [Candidatus Spongiihabitans sp.]|uniref:hypothetical protein n=1 Tax=Candidatus Spongiihabitans sp. TaxID=3101308 RepID=UPI003C7BCDCC